MEHHGPLKSGRTPTYETIEFHHLHPERGMRLLDLRRLHDRAWCCNGAAA